MTNAEAAQHFASLPPDQDAEVLVVNGDTGSADAYTIEPPGTNLEDIDPELQSPWKTAAAVASSWFSTPVFRCTTERWINRESLPATFGYREDH